METKQNVYYYKVRNGLMILALGFLIFLLGVRPGIFFLDRSPVIGFVQIAVFSVGLAVMCFAGIFTLNALWNGSQRSILADVGYRLVLTGYVVVVLSGLADVFGIGTHRFPAVPYFGFVQAVGVMLGQLTIALGFIMMIPHNKKPAS